MEWKLTVPSDGSEASAVLETFLGGMETDASPPAACGRVQSLKPSLVEWKRATVYEHPDGLLTP